MKVPTDSVVLSHFVAHHFGDGSWRWHPETMEHELNRTFLLAPEDDLTSGLHAKVHALQVLFTSDGPKNDWMSFEKVVQGLLGNAVLFRIMQPPNLPQLFLAADILVTLDPDFFREVGDEVGSYIAAVFADAEVPWVPAPFIDVPDIQAKVTELTGIDPVPFEDDFRSARDEPASALLTHCFDSVMKQRKQRNKELS